jgi:hypothetical protein
MFRQRLVVKQVHRVCRYSHLLMFEPNRVNNSIHSTAYASVPPGYDTKGIRE